MKELLRVRQSGLHRVEQEMWQKMMCSQQIKTILSRSLKWKKEGTKMILLDYSRIKGGLVCLLILNSNEPNIPLYT